MSQSVSQSVRQSVSPSVRQSVSQSVSESLSESVSQSVVSQAVRQSVRELEIQIQSVRQSSTKFFLLMLSSKLALATMVTSYVTALNTPGTVPNVQKAWDVFVSSKCTQVKAAAIESYDKTMESEMAGKLPCERDVIRQAQVIALDKALKMFEEETFGISAANIESYLSELTVRKPSMHFLYIRVIFS